ncbi:MAG: hypothetical protein GX362_01710 [Methanosarcinaceae archaeon]|nr:hypothetical protein [Methanosarcinaceae archaeon]
MKACNKKPCSFSVFEMYKEIIDVFIIDELDNTWSEKDFKTAKEANVKVLKTDTIMKTKEDSINLASFILKNTDLH